jgi:hypothetical protein
MKAQRPRWKQLGPSASMVADSAVEDRDLERRGGPGACGGGPGGPGGPGTVKAGSLPTTSVEKYAEHD